MGGICKTELAIEHILSRRDKFDATFWLSAETVWKLSASFRETSRELGLEDPATGFTDEIATREIVKNWISKPLKTSSLDNLENEIGKAKWLLVFDNADDPDLLFDWWPVTGIGSIIITSRVPLTKDTPYTPTAGVDLAPFSNEEDCRLLQKISKRELERNSLELCARNSESLGGLPLALTQMGVILHHRHFSLLAFLESYQEDAKMLQEIWPVGQQIAYRQTVASVWAVEELPPPPLALLEVLSVFGPDRIQEKMLMQGAKNVGFKYYPKTKSKYFEARYQLFRASLITRGIGADEMRIHRLVQEVVREKMEQDRLKAAFETAIDLISEVWPFTFQTRNNAWRYPMYETYLPQVLKLLNLFGERIKSGTFNASVQTANPFNDAACYGLCFIRIFILHELTLIRSIIGAPLGARSLMKPKPSSRCLKQFSKKSM